MHYLGSFPELEDQMCSFTTAFDRRTAGFSPGRVDALVWAITELMVEPMAGFGIFEYYRRLATGLPLTAPRPVTIDVAVDNRTEWRRGYDERSAAQTPDHPDSNGGETEWVNGPLSLLPRVDTKMLAIKKERERYAALMADRLPTAEEVAEHVAIIDRIKRGERC